MGKQIALETATKINTVKKQDGPGNGFAHQMALQEAIWASRFNPLDQKAFVILGRKERISVLQIGGSKETAKATEEFFKQEGMLVDMTDAPKCVGAWPLKEGGIRFLDLASGYIVAKPNEFDYIIAFGETGGVDEILKKCLKDGGVMFDNYGETNHPPSIRMHTKVMGTIETKQGDFLNKTD